MKYFRRLQCRRNGHLLPSLGTILSSTRIECRRCDWYRERTTYADAVHDRDGGIKWTGRLY